VRAETRHQLKQDRFSRATLEAAGKTADWTVEHKSKLIAGVVVALLLIAAAVGIWYYLDQQDQKASAELSAAVRTVETPLRASETPAQQELPTFTSPKERVKAAHDQFQAIVDRYPHTRSADMARYFLGIAAVDLGDNAAAERYLRETASSGPAELAALGKFALASLYRNTNRDAQAIDLYKQLIDKPTSTVSKVTTQMALADLYQSKQQPEEAKRIYEQIQKENPATEIGSLAASKLQELGKAH